MSDPAATTSLSRTISLFAAPVLALLLGWLSYRGGLSAAACITAAITLLCAVWWIFEPIPIPATSLLPLALLPLLGVLTGDQIASAYGHPLILLLMGGFILSTSLEKSGVHRRLALHMIHVIGGNSDRRIILAFMITAATLSMWISNTATSLMLLPVALAVIDSAKHKTLAVPLILGLGYAASVGGIGTPIGTPPNILMMNVYTEATGIELTFVDWMMWGVPLVILLIPVMWLWLTRRGNHQQQIVIPEVGQWQSQEKRVLIVFAITALLWVTRKIPFGGWSELTGLTSANDASVALLAVVAMFLIPGGNGSRLLDWKTANRIPWGVLLLFAGGIAIAKAFTVSGLSQVIGEQIAAITSLPLILVIASIALIVTFLTEITSNTATTALMMPVLAAAAITANIEPAILMVPAAMSASCAFMLPVATGPNAVIYSSGKITVRDMVRAGLGLNLLGTLAVTTVTFLVL